MGIWGLGAAAAVALIAAVVPAEAATQAADPASCTRALAGPALSADAHKRCMVAIGNAYLDAEADPTSARALPIAEDAARHVLGRPASRGPGGRAAILAALDQSTVASIKNRVWSVEGDVAYVIYDAALRTNPAPTPYHLGERITIAKGQIMDILVLAPSGVQ